MTTCEIISGIKLIHDEVAALKAQSEKDGHNPSWLSVAKGALATAIHQVELHKTYVESQLTKSESVNRK
ncbi:MAG: hypothetical protein ABSH38_14810 [Verrucomicrobiota bacterium]|jgi:hypothetical protein